MAKKSLLSGMTKNNLKSVKLGIVFIFIIFISRFENILVPNICFFNHIIT